MGLMVALLPYPVDADDIGFTGGLPVDELHVTSRYYGTDTPPDVAPALRHAATGIGERFAPFVANIDGYGPLGSDTPQALVLHLDAPEFHEIRDLLPEPDPDGSFTVYPTYLPHLTLGYGIPDHAAENVDGTVGIKFDRIAVCDGDDWFVVPLTGTQAVTAAAGPFALLKHPKSKIPAFTRKQRDQMIETGEACDDGSYPIRDGHGEQDLVNAIQAVGRAKDRKKVEAHIRRRAEALGLEDKLPPWLTAGQPAHAAAVGRKKKNRQRCYGGTPRSCKSVRWIRVYEALRNKGMSKRRAAMISNSMYKHWVTGVPRRRDKRPIVRRAFP